MKVLYSFAKAKLQTSFFSQIRMFFFLFSKLSRNKNSKNRTQIRAKIPRDIMQAKELKRTRAAVLKPHKVEKLVG